MKKIIKLGLEKREHTLMQYQKMVVLDSLKARKIIKTLDYKNDHRLLQCIAQTYLDEARFKDDGTMRNYVNMRKWKLAEKFISKAFGIKGNCGYVLFTMGSISKLVGQKPLAIFCFRTIVKLGVKGLSVNGCDCNLSYDFASELINDCKFEFYRIYFESNPKLANKYLKMYKAGLENGIATIYKPLDKFLL